MTESKLNKLIETNKLNKLNQSDINYLNILEDEYGHKCVTNVLFFLPIMIQTI